MSATENDTTTEKATHTPGPWTVGDPTLVQHDYPKRYVSETVSIHAPGRACVATAYAGHEGGSVGRPYVSLPEGRANWQVIAAAPDMLQALYEIAGDCYALDEFASSDNSVPHCRFCDHSEGAKHDPDCVMQFVDEAIAKAEGR